MAIKVLTPADTFNGMRGGVAFVKGVGIFEDEDKGRSVANSLGYKVEEIKKPKPTPKPKPKTTAKKTTKKASK